VEKQRTPERVVEAAPEDLSHPDGLPCSVGSGSKRELAFSGLCRIPPAADMPPHETTREEVAVREPPAGIGRRLRAEGLPTWASVRHPSRHRPPIEPSRKPRGVEW